MAKQAVLVRYRIKAGKMDAFLQILKGHIAATRASEPGCVQFDVLKPYDEKDTVHVYEVYADDEAFRLHNASSQLANYKAATQALLHERAITWCVVVE